MYPRAGSEGKTARINMTNTALINNRYRILKTLGRGGFGETYLAEDMHMPSGRKCVLKQLKPIVQQPVIPLWMKERFQREAAILEDLGAASPQIPELYAYFSEDQQFYLVQELIAGQTLGQQWTETANFSSTEVSTILQQILPVLDFIHSQKIVHRDIKPDNIILRYSDNLPVLIDFGAVKETLATTVEHNSQSVSAAIGTPGYMPSEQAAGRPVYSSDLYSLGLTAIFLLTGKVPQELDLDPQTGEIIWQQYAQGVDTKLVAVLDKAIKFHPRDRYSSASEMLQALESSFGQVATPSLAATQVTGATVKVAPAAPGISIRSKFGGTVAYEQPAHQSQPKKQKSWLSKIFLFLLVAGGLSLGSLVLGFMAVSNWWQNLWQPAPQTTVPETSMPSRPTISLPKPDKPVVKLPPEVAEPELEPAIPEIEPEIPELEVPTIILEPNQQPQPEIATKPHPPQPETTPVATMGTSEAQLVSTLGKPTSERSDPRKNRRILTYRNASNGNLNATYQTDDQGKIRQADVALNQNLSLGSMQNTLTKLLGGNANADAKNKLRAVYNRESDRYSFRTGTMQGSIYRDSKDRVNISVWQ